MSKELRNYLDLEKIMLEAEAVDERAADAVRDIMDEAWYRLSDEDRRALDARTIPGPMRVLEAVRLPMTKALFQMLVSPLPKRTYDRTPVLGWRSVA
jgi:hypothetical protein